MGSCLRALFAKLFKRPVYRKVSSEDEIELIEHRYVVKNILYKNRNIVKNLSNVIMFHRDGIRINGAFVRYEYIPVIHRSTNNVVVLPTFTNIIDNVITKSDYISTIHIRFSGKTECETFAQNLLCKMVLVKESGTYDKDVFRFRVARRFITK